LQNGFRGSKNKGRGSTENQSIRGLSSTLHGCSHNRYGVTRCCRESLSLEYSALGLRPALPKRGSGVFASETLFAFRFCSADIAYPVRHRHRSSDQLLVAWGRATVPDSVDLRLFECRQTLGGCLGRRTVILWPTRHAPPRPASRCRGQRASTHINASILSRSRQRPKKKVRWCRCQWCQIDGATSDDEVRRPTKAK